MTTMAGSVKCHDAFFRLKEGFMFHFKKFLKDSIWKKATVFSLALAVSATSLSVPALAATPENATVMENCGAYLFTWRPVDCGNGEYFVILNGQKTISESDVTLNRG